MISVKQQILNGLGWFLERLKTDFTQKTDIVNNCTSTTTDAPLSAAQGKALQDNINALNAELANFWQTVYPIGSIYMSTNNTNPGTIWGGTWVSWGSGRVPIGVNSSDSDFNSVEKTGGAKSISLSHAHTVNSHIHSTGGCALTISQIPSHSHNFSGTTNSVGDHWHMYRDYYEMSPASMGTDPNRQAVAANSDTEANPGAHSRAAGGHYHTISGTTGNTGNGTEHFHGDTGSSSPSTNSQLGTQSIIQPYITCYMWKRTA